MHQLSSQTTVNKKGTSIEACKNTQPSQTIVHAKLEMTTPGDYDEKEADAMADTVVNGGTIRREISNGSSGGGVAVSTAMESQLAQAKGGGRTMPDGLRNMMESGFGRDFSNVKIHTDSQAEAMNNSLSAKAFTLGNDIYFNKGQFSPNTREGQHLMAHELTHVVQGSGKVGRYEGTGYYEIKYDTEDSRNVKEAWKEGKPYISRIDLKFNELGFNVANDNKDIMLYTKGVMNVYIKNGNQVNFIKIAMSGGGDQALLYGEKHPDRYKYFTNRLKNGIFKVSKIRGYGTMSRTYSEDGDYYDLKSKGLYAKIGNGKSTEKEKYENPFRSSAGNMDYSVFFNGGEALHSGDIEQASHGCIHVGDLYFREKRERDNDLFLEVIKFINHYSVPYKKGRKIVTEVTVNYDLLGIGFIKRQLKKLGSFLKKEKKIHGEQTIQNFIKRRAGIIDSLNNVDDVIEHYEKYKKWLDF